MRRSEKGAGSERSVYRAHNDFSVPFILLLFDEYIYRKFAVLAKKGGWKAAFAVSARLYCHLQTLVARYQVLNKVSTGVLI
jgi:hypothetical protein